MGIAATAIDDSPIGAGGGGGGLCIVDNIDGWIEVVGGLVHVGPQPLPNTLEKCVRLRNECRLEAQRLQRRSGRPYFHTALKDGSFPYSDEARARLLAAAGVVVQRDGQILIVAEADATAVRELALDILGCGTEPIVTRGGDALLEHLCGGTVEGSVIRKPDFSRPATALLVRNAHRSNCTVVLHRGDLQIAAPEAFWITHHTGAQKTWRKGLVERCVVADLWRCVRILRGDGGNGTTRRSPLAVGTAFARLSGIGPAEGTPEALARERRKDFERILRTPIPAGKTGMRRACWHSSRQVGGGAEAPLQCRSGNGCPSRAGDPQSYPDTLWRTAFLECLEMTDNVALAAQQSMPPCVAAGYTKHGSRFDAARIVAAVVDKLPPDVIGKIKQAAAGRLKD